MTSTLIARLKLSQSLIDLAELSTERTTALLTAFDEAGIPAVRKLCLDTLSDIRDAVSTLMAITEVDEDPASSERTMDSAARAMAIAIHMLALIESQSGRLSPKSTSSTVITNRVKRLEDSYADNLLNSRVAAELGNARLLSTTLSSLVELAEGDLRTACKSLGGRSDNIRSKKLVAVRLASVARRIAMLSAACIHLLHRMTNKRRAAGLKKVAEGRTTLRQPTQQIFAALESLTSAPVGSRWPVSLRCQDINWLEGPNGRTVIDVEAGALTRLVFPHRNAIRSGVASDSWLYTEGVIETDSDGLFLKIPPRAVGSAASTVWEDYLVTQVRDIYDLHPRSIALMWELPDLRELGGRNDLFGRL